MDWEQLFQKWETALNALRLEEDESEDESSEFEVLTKEAQAALECSPVPDEDWVLSVLEGTTDEDKCRRHFIRTALRGSRQMADTLFQPMLRAAVYEQDPSFNRLFIQPCLLLAGPRKVNEVLLEYLENGTDGEKAGAASAFYWAIGLRGRDGVVDEDINDLTIRVRYRFLSEYVSNTDVRVRQRILPMLTLKLERYPEAMHPLITQAIALSRAHPDEYIRHRIEVQLGSGGPFKSLPN